MSTLGIPRYGHHSAFERLQRSPDRTPVDGDALNRLRNNAKGFSAMRPSPQQPIEPGRVKPVKTAPSEGEGGGSRMPTFIAIALIVGTIAVVSLYAGGYLPKVTLPHLRA